MVNIRKIVNKHIINHNTKVLLLEYPFSHIFMYIIIERTQKMNNTRNFQLCIFIALLTFCFSGSLFAQYKHTKQKKMEISVSGTYLFGGVLPVTNGELNFVNNYGFQGDFNYKLTPKSSAGVSYTYIPTELRFKNFQNYGNESKLFDLDIHYFYVNYLFESDDNKAVPYGLVGFGGVIMDPKDDAYDSEFRFATTIAGGIKLYASNSLGFKFQARLLLPLYYATNTIYVSPSGVGYTTGAGTVLQADLSAGLIFKF